MWYILIWERPSLWGYSIYKSFGFVVIYHSSDSMQCSFLLCSMIPSLILIFVFVHYWSFRVSNSSTSCCFYGKPRSKQSSLEWHELAKLYGTSHRFFFSFLLLQSNEITKKYRICNLSKDAPKTGWKYRRFSRNSFGEI